MPSELLKSFRQNVELVQGRDVGATQITTKIVVATRIATVDTDTREEAVKAAQELYQACLDAINEAYGPI